MVTSQEWIDIKWSKEAKGKKMASYILQESYWKNVIYSLKLTNPLVKVLLIVEKRSLQWIIFMRPWIELRQPLPKDLDIKKRIMKRHLNLLMQDRNANFINLPNFINICMHPDIS